MTIVWSPQAVADVEAAVAYLLESSPPAAERLAGGLLALVERLATEPLDGPTHVLTNGEQVRGWPHPLFRVDYQRSGAGLLVLRVYHQRRVPITR